MFHLKERFCVCVTALVLVGCTSGAELTKPKVSLLSDKAVSDKVASDIGAPNRIVAAPDNAAPLSTVSSQKVIATSGDEYFSEKQYGVKASPRVANVTPSALQSNFNDSGSSLVSYAGKVGLAPPATKLKRGGGRAQIGKPYTIRGKRFVPRKQPNYNQTGYASWYGSAFHGRLTANGEVYDMNHLSAAHPTLPLPSYVRVTNVGNGRSVIVRVNDRGPFAKNRIIDLSRRAALALGTTKAGVAKVNVKYVGPAPVNGEDDTYLLSSYRAPNMPAKNDTVVAALPQSVTAGDNALTRRPPSPLSFAEHNEPLAHSPYAQQQAIIYVPNGGVAVQNLAKEAWVQELGHAEHTRDGVYITLHTLAHANKAMKQFWHQGFENAMFYRR